MAFTSGVSASLISWLAFFPGVYTGVSEKRVWMVLPCSMLFAVVILSFLATFSLTSGCLSVIPNSLPSSSTLSRTSPIRLPGSYRSMSSSDDSSWSDSFLSVSTAGGTTSTSLTPVSWPLVPWPCIRFKWRFKYALFLSTAPHSMQFIFVISLTHSSRCVFSSSSLTNSFWHSIQSNMHIIFTSIAFSVFI
jgi:hypothetical protein